MTKKKNKEIDSMYCRDCGHCGFIECCGITDFLKKHVVGKTGCDNEAAVLSDLITLLNLSLIEEMQQEYLEPCLTCKSVTCSGWHEVGEK